MKELIKLDAAIARLNKAGVGTSVMQLKHNHSALKAYINGKTVSVPVVVGVVVAADIEEIIALHTNVHTIHDDARERIELAMTYAEDGAFLSAARLFREIADMYDKRAKDVY